jgi:hypothetical protein
MVARSQDAGTGDKSGKFRKSPQEVDQDEGAGLAREKRLEIEAVTGTPVVSSRNMLKAPDGGLWAALNDADEENG